MYYYEVSYYHQNMLILYHKSDMEKRQMYVYVNGKRLLTDVISPCTICLNIGSTLSDMVYRISTPSDTVDSNALM